MPPLGISMLAAPQWSEVLQSQAGETDAETSKQTVQELLDQGEEVVHNGLEAQQEAGERRIERGEAAQERGCVLRQC